MTRKFQLVVVEGALEVFIATKLLTSLDALDDGVRPVDKGGRNSFWARAADYNRAARHFPVFGLVDLEQSRCASGLIAEQLSVDLHPDFALRIAVRMVESWLLADAASLARFLNVSQAVFPVAPDEEQSPKLALVNLARRSRSRRIREALVPDAASHGIVGPDYTATLGTFAAEAWAPLRAQARSKSLARAVMAIQRVCSA